MPYRLSWTLPGYRRLRRSRSIVAVSLLLAPMGAGVKLPDESPDSLVTADTDDNPRATTLRFGAGQGRYGRTIHAERVISLGYSDCTGGPVNDVVGGDFRFRNEYRDYGAELDIQTGESFHVGLRGGWIDETAHYLGSTLDQSVIDTLFANQHVDTTFSQYYFNPYVSAETPTWGLGAGFVYSDNRLWTDETRNYDAYDDGSFYPTAHIRLGRLDQVYLTASLWEGVPIYSGGGTYTYGVGLRPVRPLDLWVGFSDGGPYSDRDFLVRTGLDLGRHITVDATARIRSDADETFQPNFTEYGTAISVRYRFLRE